MQQFTLSTYLAILLSSVGFPREPGTCRCEVRKMDSLEHAGTPKGPLICLLSRSTLACLEELLPILYVARIMLGSFCTDARFSNMVNILIAPLCLGQSR